MQKEAKRYLLDTSALFTFTDNEEGSDAVQHFLEAASKQEALLFVSMMSIMELYYVTCQEVDEQTAEQLVVSVRSLPLDAITLTDELALPAASLKARFHISVADAWIAATAKANDLILIHKDPEFEPLKNECEMLELPFKFSRKSHL